MAALPGDVQADIQKQMSHVVMWPQMFPLVLDHPRWRNHRKFVVRRRWTVLYRVVVSTTGEEQVYVIRIVPARSHY